MHWVRLQLLQRHHLVHIADQKVAVEANLTEYLREIAFDEGTTYVSYAQLSSVVSGSAGVLDQSDLQVNGGTENIPLTNRQTPVLGEVVLTQ